MTSAAALGTAASFGLMATRNMAVSGRPLVTTFYAKAGSGELSIPAETAGFDSVFGNFPIAASLLMCWAAAAAVFMCRKSGQSVRLHR